MNGLALHGGVLPYSGTFLVFSDYSRPAIRLAALMGLRVIHVLTHDSIGLGEDGPTHQPVEHLAALRAIPDLFVFRPCDAVETIECWQLAIERDGPSALALTRQNLPQLRHDSDGKNRCCRGAYEIIPAEHGAAAVSIFATGSEVSIAAEARNLLGDRGIAARVVSVPCFELFARQPADYRRSVLGTGARVAVEAAVGQGWEAITGTDGAFVGMRGFGASAPYKELYKKFGITAEAVAESALGLLNAKDGVEG
jgi:transketolase